MVTRLTSVRIRAAERVVGKAAEHPVSVFHAATRDSNGLTSIGWKRSSLWNTLAKTSCEASFAFRFWRRPAVNASHTPPAS